MSRVGKGLGKSIVLGLLVAGAVATIGGAAEAVPGTVRRDSVNVPLDAQCGGSAGTALAVVSGGKAGFPKIPVLLVTSCVSGPPAAVKVFLLDPSTNPATVKKTITTAFVGTANLPANGWEALVLRSDKGDLVGCGMNAGTVLWSIDFSPFNTVNDGTATFLRPGPSGSSCSAIAWDASNKTFYQTPASGTAVLHFTEAVGGSLPTGNPTSIAVPAFCDPPVAGLGVAGTSLFVAVTCTEPGFDAAPEIRQVYKVDGSPVRFFPAPSSNPSGLPDDPTTLASEYKELLWTLDPAALMFDAVEIPGGTVGQLTGAPVLFPGVGDPAVASSCQPDPASATGAYKSSAGDALLDCWKAPLIPWADHLPGISYAGVYDGNLLNRDIVLCGATTIPADCASTIPTQKDLFVEIDYMAGHLPDPAAITQVIAVFANAPTPPGPVRLHVQLSDPNDAIPHNLTTALVPCTPAAATGNADFDVLKAQFFGTVAERTAVQNNPNANVLNAKALAFRYGMFVHNLTPAGATTSGCAEIGGNDFVVALGSWGSVNGHNVGTTDQQAGTFLHELGHTLGLRHGGGDNVNCKPNYASVMNYTRQFSSPVTNRALDYSREALGGDLGSGVIGLNKGSLIESVGIRGALLGFTGKIAFGPVASQLAKPAVADASAGISWNKDTDTQDAPSLDINQTTPSTGGCPANQGTLLDGTGSGNILLGFNDWANIQFNFRGSQDFGGGQEELNLDTALALSRDVIDIKPNDKKNTIVASATQTVGVTIFSRLDNSTPPQVELDATTIDPSTLILRGTNGATWAIPVKTNANGKFQCSTKDVNKDGLVDLSCDFQIPVNTLSVTETKAVLEGSTFPPIGQPVHSSDFIQVLP